MGIFSKRTSKGGGKDVSASLASSHRDMDALDKDTQKMLRGIIQEHVEKATKNLKIW